MTSRFTATCSQFKIHYRDAAQKHYLTHRKASTAQPGPDQSTTEPIPTTEKRLQAACVNCANTKSKCDRQYPCGRCRLRSLSCAPRAAHRSSSSFHSGAIEQELSIQPGVINDTRPTRGLNRDDNEMEDVVPSPGIRKQSDARLGSLATLEGRGNSQLNNLEGTRMPSGSCPGPVAAGIGPENDQLFHHTTASPSAGSGSGQYILPQLPRRAEERGGRESNTPLHTTSMRDEPAFTPSVLRPDTSKPTYTGEMPYPMPETPGDGMFLLQQDSNPDVHQSSASVAVASPLAAKEAQISFLPPPATDPSGIFEDVSQVFSQFDWGWEGLFASQAATPNFQAFLPTAIEDLSPVTSVPAHSVTTPTRSVENVARLGDNFADAAPWTEMSTTWRAQHFLEGERFEVVALTETTRERMLAIAQTFFRLALDSLNVSSNPGMRFLMADTNRYSSSSILLLPPTTILHTYLDAFLTSFEPSYPLVASRSLDPNTIAADKHEQLAIVLLLLMIGYGAMRDSAIKARRLSMGLLEICCLTILHLLDKDSTNPRSAIAAHCALLSTYQLAFSGDKWLMASSLGQMHQYLIVSIRRTCPEESIGAVTDPCILPAVTTFTYL